jgi:hypothetical protein
VSANELDWSRDRARFVADQVSRDHGFPLGPLAQQFATLTYSLLDATTSGEVLDQVVQATTDVVPGADVVSVTLRTPDGRFFTPARTDPLAAELDQLQFGLGEGPCVEAARAAGPGVVACRDLAAEPLWPRFGPAAAERGINALMSTTLLPHAQLPQLSGALNIYSHSRRGLDEASQSAALLLATHASLALAYTHAVETAELQATNLRRAIDSRDVIGQAKGILMNRRGMSADDAFDLLRSTSQDLNVKLVELAETLATRHTELDPPIA